MHDLLLYLHKHKKIPADVMMLFETLKSAYVAGKNSISNLQTQNLKNMNSYTCPTISHKVDR